MLAHPLTTADEMKYDPYNFFASLKLDGQRCVWVPHTQGLNISEVPWANRMRDSRSHTCTGLWSRYGKVIHCPTWFIAQFPKDECLDGELYMGRGKFNELESCVRKLVPYDHEWASVKYYVFDAPHYDTLFQDGHSGNARTQQYKFDFKDLPRPRQPGNNRAPFEQTYYRLVKQYAGVDNLIVHEQKRVFTWDAVYDMMYQEVDIGGEGVILRAMNSAWRPQRTHDMLKVKPWFDAEATVIGWTEGKGKHSGRIGALKLRMPDGKEFDLSGLTDQERMLRHDGAGDPICFQIGHTITYKYRELTPDGIPREARYYRKFN